jgi:hypothetical protein
VRAALERDLRCFDSATSQAAAASQAGAFSSAKGSLKEALSLRLAPAPSGAAPPPPAADGAAAAPAPPAPPAGLGPLLRQAHVVSFLMRALLIGYGNGTQQSFTFLLIQQMGGTALLMGLMLLVSPGPWRARAPRGGRARPLSSMRRRARPALARPSTTPPARRPPPTARRAGQCSVLTEVPAFQFQSVLLARFPVAAVMSCSMALMAVKLGAYALLPLAPTPWLVLPIELLHGATRRRGAAGRGAMLPAGERAGSPGAACRPPACLGRTVGPRRRRERAAGSRGARAAGAAAASPAHMRPAVCRGAAAQG